MCDNLSPHLVPIDTMNNTHSLPPPPLIIVLCDTTENRFIVNTLLETGSNQHSDGWDTSSKVWTHMVLHLPHTVGGFDVTFKVTKDTAFYTTTTRFVTCLGTFSQDHQGLWLPKDGHIVQRITNFVLCDFMTIVQRSSLGNHNPW